MDDGRVTAMTLLDHSAAFDTIDHIILLRRLEDWVGVSGKELDWFKSYLTGRSQRIKLGNCLSSRSDLSFGVPRGQFLVLYFLHSIPLHSLAWSRGMLSLIISMLTIASCVFPFHRATLLQQLMVYWLPVKYRVHFKICLLTSKACHEEQPVYLRSLIATSLPSRSLRSDREITLSVPRIKTETGARAFSSCAHSPWNNFPLFVRSATFRRRLKTYLFDLASPPPSP